MEQDTLLNLLIGTGLGVAVVACIAFAPWFLMCGIGFGIGLYLRQWSRFKRFKGLKVADRKTFWEVEHDGLDITATKHGDMLYLGESADGTIRYWYDDGYYYPQAIDDGTMYWDKGVKINNANLRKQLDGFQEMGNEWPAYYNEVILADKRKESKSKAKQMKNAASAFLEENPEYYKLDLEDTVNQLRKEIEGYCPTIDFAAAGGKK